MCGDTRQHPGSWFIEELLQPPISLELNMCLFALSARYKN